MIVGHAIHHIVPIFLRETSIWFSGQDANFSSEFVPEILHFAEEQFSVSFISEKCTLRNELQRHKFFKA